MLFEGFIDEGFSLIKKLAFLTEAPFKEQLMLRTANRIEAFRHLRDLLIRTRPHISEQLAVVCCNLFVRREGEFLLGIDIEWTATSMLRRFPFDDGIVEIAESLADRGIRVIVGGLDRDFRGEPFGPMPELLARAEFVTKLTAICVKSGLPATRTQRIINGKPAHYSDPTILVGANESYEPRSRHYHEVPGKPKKV